MNPVLNTNEMSFVRIKHFLEIWIGKLLTISIKCITLTTTNPYHLIGLWCKNNTILNLYHLIGPWCKNNTTTNPYNEQDVSIQLFIDLQL